MFVIAQAWNNFARTKKSLSDEVKFGITMEKAGVAITVTSLTDFLAFAVGSTTVCTLLDEILWPTSTSCSVTASLANFQIPFARFMKTQISKL